jgi:hypothetical protein
VMVGKGKNHQDETITPSWLSPHLHNIISVKTWN